MKKGTQKMSEVDKLNVHLLICGITDTEPDGAFICRR